jgi:hypothetical protein
VLAQPKLFGSSHGGVVTLGSRNFTNNLLNASSILGLVGINIVNGVKVTEGNLGSRYRYIQVENGQQQ